MNTIKKLFFAVAFATVLSCTGAATVGSLFGENTEVSATTASVKETKKEAKKASAKKETKKEKTAEGTPAVEEVQEEVTNTATQQVTSYGSDGATYNAPASNNASSTQEATPATSSDGTYVGNGGEVHQEAEVVSTTPATTPVQEKSFYYPVTNGVSEDSIVPPATFADGTVVSVIETELD